MRAYLKYGLGTGLVSGLWTIGSFSVIGLLNTSFFNGNIEATQIRSYGGLFSILLLILGIYFGMREVKRNNGNTITYQQAVKTGIIIACITGITLAFFSYLYCTFINPGYAEFMVKDTERSLLAAGKAPNLIAQDLESVRKQFTPPAQVGMALISQIVVGSVASLIMGLLLRTKSNNSI